MHRIAVAIPTLNSANHLEALLPKLRDQVEPVHEILVIDSSSDDDTVHVAHKHGARVEVIRREDFNHGSTRNLAASLVAADTLIFLSHDVRPIDNAFVQFLTAPIRNGLAHASYARQRGGPDAIPTEAFLREYNYPPVAHVRTQADIERLGIHAFFFSNAAAAYSLKEFHEVGGFPSDTILSEDIILSSRLLRAGYKVAYAADAVVEHTHNYSLRQQFRRYFDIGVAYKEAKDELQVGATLRKGSDFARKQVAWMWKNGKKKWIPFGIGESAIKLFGYHIGERHRILPRCLKRRLSMHRAYWK